MILSPSRSSDPPSDRDSPLAHALTRPLAFCIHRKPPSPFASLPSPPSPARFRIIAVLRLARSHWPRDLQPHPLSSLPLTRPLQPTPRSSSEPRIVTSPSPNSPVLLIACTSSVLCREDEPVSCGSIQHASDQRAQRTRLILLRLRKLQFRPSSDPPRHSAPPPPAMRIICSRGAMESPSAVSASEWSDTTWKRSCANLLSD